MASRSSFSTSYPGLSRRRPLVYGLGALAALAVASLSAGGCFLNSAGEGGSSGTGGGGTGGMNVGGCKTAGECDDGKPCTQDKCDLDTGKCSNEPNDMLTPPQDANDCDKEVCQSGAVAHENLPDTEPCGTGAPLHCNGQGQCVGCTTDGECGMSTECVTYTCNMSQVCETMMVAQGTKVTDPTANDCMGMFCDGVGMAMAGPDNMDLPMNDGNECTDEVCANGMEAHPLKMAGATCATGFCSSTGTCVACAIDSNCPMGSTCYMESACVSCTDGMQNGNETGVDCGGSCKKCNGETCMTGADCSSTFCADGVCCNAACDAMSLCRSCNLPGKAGVCSVVPDGMTDLDSCTDPMKDKVCDGTSGGGACKDLGTTGLIGATCGGNPECFNDRCIAGNICGLSTGNPCVEDYTCSTKLCTNNICTECTMDAQCKSGMCDTGAKACKIPLGEPCTASGGVPACAQGTCKGNPGLCKLNIGEACTKYTDCTGYCDANMQCAACTTNAQCGTGTCDMGSGTCLLPAGASCTTGTVCSSGMCTGFPPKCQ